MKTIESINLIYRDPNVRGGRPCLVGTGLRVMDIVMERQHGEADPEKIAAIYEIPVGGVYAALAYYYEHKEEIDKDIQKDDDYIRHVKGETLGRQPS
ncbi:MAG: DUF433 domain-containing protein [Chloroflexota bacterium]|nr:DUF433 domain-containing protein [Chloroflexota bacterium]MDE2949687.1 DUF433 domain-containing protein [Chloroflexota bacterium]